MDPQALINAVSLRPPTFMPGSCDLWFMLLESHFRSRNISSELTKYDVTLQALPAEVLERLHSFFTAELPDQPYTALQYELRKIFRPSTKRSFLQLQHEEILGDGKPSDLLARMRRLAGSQDKDSNILKQMFLDKLPVNVQTVLAVTNEEATLEHLADMADRMVDVQQPQQRSNTVATNSDPAPTRLDRLESLMLAIQAEVRNGSAAQANKRRAQHPKIRQQTHVKPTLCWYHAKYGELARKCVQPCTFSGNANASS